MLNRCNNPNTPAYKYYGARGIRVCNDWNHISKFPLFLEHLGRRPSPNHQLDRIDNNGHYGPDNCRWATRSDQMKNTRRNRRYTLNGETLCIREWAARYGIREKTLHYRLNRGLPLEQALTLISWQRMPYALRDLTPEQRHARKMEKIREWQRNNPEKVAGYVAARAAKRAARIKAESS